MKKYLNKALVFGAATIAYLTLASASFAQDTIGRIAKPSIIPGIDAGTFLSGLIGLIIIVAFLAAFIYLLWGGFQWVTSGGDEGAVSAARQRIVQALIGLVVVISSWAIFQLVERAFHVDILGADLGKLFDQLFPTQ